jgi:NTE family protein
VAGRRRRINHLPGGPRYGEGQVIEPAFKSCVIEVSFDAIADPETRRRFRNLPTRFDLSPDDLQAVIDMGGNLLRQSPHFVSLVRLLGGPVEGAPEPGMARCE